MNTPNSATAIRKVRPARPGGGRSASQPDISTAPIAGAARSPPRPSGPTWRISWAKIGRIATAPPNSTARRSSTIAPTNTRRVRRNASPAFTLASSGSARPVAGRSGARICPTVPSAAAISAAATTYDAVGPIHP